jgi:hypothetical protein
MLLTNSFAVSLTFLNRAMRNCSPLILAVVDTRRTCSLTCVIEDYRGLHPDRWPGPTKHRLPSSLAVASAESRRLASGPCRDLVCPLASFVLWIAPLQCRQLDCLFNRPNEQQA